MHSRKPPDGFDLTNRHWCLNLTQLRVLRIHAGPGQTGRKMPGKHRTICRHQINRRGGSEIFRHDKDGNAIVGQNQILAIARKLRLKKCDPFGNVDRIGTCRSVQCTKRDVCAVSKIIVTGHT